MLCDFAQVREGLLFVSSGGITRVAAPALGAPVSISVAGELEVLNDDVASALEGERADLRARLAGEPDRGVGAAGEADGVGRGRQLTADAQLGAGPGERDGGGELGEGLGLAAVAARGRAGGLSVGPVERQMGCSGALRPTSPWRAPLPPLR